MRRFLALYLIPIAVMEEWQRTEPETRQPAEEKMRAEWGRWMGEYAVPLKASEAVGKTKRVSAHGIADGKNEITFYSIAEADSLEAAAEMFASNPHLTIPQSSIEIMELHGFAGP